MTWHGKGKCDMWVGGDGCHGAGFHGAEFHGAGLVPCNRAMLWAIARDPSGLAASSSAAPARNLWLTAQHSVPGHILHPQAWLGACLHTGAVQGTQSEVSWTADSLLTSPFVSGQMMSLHLQRPSLIAPSPCAPPMSAPSSASAPRTSWGGKEGPQCFLALSQAAFQPWAVALSWWDSSGHDGWVPRAAQSSPTVQCEAPQQPGWLMVWALLPLSLPPSLHRGKFGEVHTCTEKETGLKLAAKVIRKQGAKDKV